MAVRPPSAGAFRDRIVIERRGTVSDGMGGVEETWSVVGQRVAAAIIEQRGSEQVQSNRLSSIAAVDVWFRASASLAIAESDRLRDVRTGALYDVKWVGYLDEMNRYLLVVATRGELSDGG